MLEPLQTWKQTLKQVSFTDQSIWTSQVARWAATRTTMKMTLSGIVGPVTFTFNLALFDMLLRTCVTTEKPWLAAVQIAAAWETSIIASPMLVLPGASLGAPTPATTWATAGALIDPISIAKSKVRLVKKIATAEAVADGFFSMMAEAFHEGFLGLTYTVAGVNCLPIPSPLVAPFNPTN